MAAGYDKWTQQQLIQRIHELETKVAEQAKILTTNTSEPSPATFTGFPIPSPGPQQLAYRKPPKQPPKAFDASKYSSRLIALKFAYLGQKYNGFEHHKNNNTPLPTIEEELWKALVKTRLISPSAADSSEYSRLDRKTFEAWDRDGAEVNWEGCEYSKCGRTDRGVSAFGQVIGVRVRSNRPLPKVDAPSSVVMGEQEEKEKSKAIEDPLLAQKSASDASSKPFNDPQDELPYIQLLNRVLPPDIRIYAWCPNPPPNFSARFACKERRYKYFFTNPSFAPVPNSSGLYSTNTTQKTMREGWLDIDAMKQGCRELVGLHDFRNMCKIDASKQLTNFKRRIFYAGIEEVSPLSVPTSLSHPAMQSPSSSPSAEPPKVYSFTLHGSAFLWHQVRSIVAILFLIGQGLEPPSLIPSLLDISANPTRPKYEMASDAPLVLWDCIFPHEREVQNTEEREKGYEDRLQWIYVGDKGGFEPRSLGKGKGTETSSMGRGKWGRGGVVDDVWEMWRGHKIDETLSALLLDTVVAQGTSTLDAELAARRGEGSGEAGTIGIVKGGPRVFDGANMGRTKGNYTPILQRERQEPVEVVNERYAKKKGWDPNRPMAKEEEADE